MVPGMALHGRLGAGASGAMVKDGERGVCCRGAVRGAEVRAVLTRTPGPGKEGKSWACVPAERLPQAEGRGGL